MERTGIIHAKKRRGTRDFCGAGNAREKLFLIATGVY